MAEGSGSFADVGAGIGEFGAAVGDLFAARGATAAAASYGKAATLEEQNAQIEAASGKLQEAAERRTVYQSLSGTRADVAGAGLKLSGSAENVLRSSAQQGTMATALISEQTAINVQGFEAQATAYTGQEEQEQALAKADKLGAIMNGISGAVSMVAAVAAA